jgi:hypothetical protein
VAVASVDCRSAFAPTRPPHNSRPRDGARPRRGARSRPPRRRRRSPLEPGRAEGQGVAIRARGGGEEPGLKQVSSRHARALSGNPPRRHHHGGGRREPEVPRRPPGPRRRRRSPVPSRGGEDAQAVQIRTCVLASRAGFPLIRATMAATNDSPPRHPRAPRTAAPARARDSGTAAPAAATFDPDPMPRVPARRARRARPAARPSARPQPRRGEPHVPHRRRDERPEPGFTNPARSPVYLHPQIEMLNADGVFSIFFPRPLLGSNRQPRRSRVARTR